MLLLDRPAAVGAEPLPPVRPLLLDLGGKADRRPSASTDPSAYATEGADTCEVAVFHADRSNGQADLSIVTTTETYPVFAYQVTASSSSDRIARFRLLEAPAGMKIDAVSGKITWPLMGVPEGIYPVTLTVEDRFGGADTQSFDITVETSFSSP